LGALMAGSLANAIGAPMTVALGGLISIIGGIVFTTRFSELGPAVRDLVAAQQMPTPAPARKSPVLCFPEKEKQTS
jgi:hypothetical protein